MRRSGLVSAGLGVVISAALLAGCGGSGPRTALPPVTGAPASRTFGALNTARGTYRMEVTFYGWPDNTPPSGQIAYPIIHQSAGGVGTYRNPITFATDENELKPGTRLYLPLVKKYLIMEDDCTECDADWSSQRKRHVDVWTNSNGRSNTNAVLNCEDQLTPANDVRVLVDPPRNLPVSRKPLYNIRRNWCYFGPNPVSTGPPVGNTPAPPDARILAPRRALFPKTGSGVHLELVFNYNVPNVDAEIGVADVVWGADAPRPRTIFNQSYTTFQREDVYGPNQTHSQAWWKAHHPDWIEYRCDRTHIAYGFGEPNMPLDIANPAVLQYQRQSAVLPALRAGYQGIAFDNVDIGNDEQHCGHYTLAGAWVQQYTGNYTDPAYARDVIAWARSTYAYVHRVSARATMAINYSYDFSASPAKNLAVMESTDMDLDERGFTNWGSQPNTPSWSNWKRIVWAIDRLQRHGNCYMENGEEPGLSADISQAERLWTVANYLLTRDDCTYMWMSGYTASGQQDYGRIITFPEYSLPIGSPLGTRYAVGSGWERAYSGGLALVNPSNASVSFPLTGSYTDENGAAYSGSITLAPKTGEILLAPST